MSDPLDPDLDLNLVTNGKTAEPQRTQRKRREVRFTKFSRRLLGVLCGSAVILKKKDQDQD